MQSLKKNQKLIISIVIVLVLGFCIYHFTSPKEVTNFTPQFEEDQTRQSSDVSASGSTESGIQIPGYTSITIPANTTDVSVELMNPDENQVYFEISFYLPDTDETIYTSKLIKPGQHIYDITLEHTMEAGEYSLTVKYATYSADDQLIPKNGAEVNCTLIVQPSN